MFKPHTENLAQVSLNIADIARVIKVIKPESCFPQLDARRLLSFLNLSGAVGLL